MEETTEERPNFSLGFNFLSNEPSAENKAEEETRFANWSESELQEILVERHSTATKKSTNWSATTFNGKHLLSMVIVVSKQYLHLFFLPKQVNYSANKPRRKFFLYKIVICQISLNKTQQIGSTAQLKR